MTDATRHPVTPARPGPARRTPIRPAFTIVELMVVIAIIGVVVATTIPALSLMQESSITSSGVNTVAVAAQAARQLATGSRAQKDPLADGGSSAGTAILVTNTGTIRLLENTGSQLNLTAEQNAFADIGDRDYITIADNVALIGILRDGPNAADLKFLAPPFAIRFNEHGSLIFGETTTAGGAYNVYYDGDYDGTFDNTDDRPDPYDPDDANNQDWIPQGAAGTVHAFSKFEVPFEEIETVVGVMIVHREDVPDLTGNDAGFIGSADAAHAAILERGTPLFFNRYTGAPVSRSDTQ